LILVHKSDGGDAPYAFFNDLKNDKVGLLNYPLSKHYREKDFLNEFYEYLPIHEWKKSGNNEFFQRIEELTETFKGRTLEREKLLKFVSENNKGYCSIQGNPGIGKSALIAQFFKDLRAQKEITNVHVVEYFIRRGTIQSQIEHMFNYLIRRTDELFIQGKEIRAEGKEVMDLQQQLFAKWRLWSEQCAGKKLLFLIDGLDEGTENNIVKYLPRENFLGVLIIYGSRPGGHKSIDDLWSELPTENHTKLELSGLSREDIRALIYEVANKYELERDSAWIDAVQKRSQGNPLYLKLLCDAIENGSIALNDIQALPEKIDEYYKAILARYAADTLDGDALLAGLFTFAAARDYLTLAHIKFINKLGDSTVLRIGSTLKEVLYENPLTETVLDYQLFHESFREYLVKEKAREVSDAAERIIDFCSTWQSHEGNWELRYCLQHYAAHATVSSRKARSSELLMLLENTEYIETQKKVLQHFDATKELFQLCLLKASELKLYDRQLEAALCLIDLKYEEANDAPKVIALVASGNPDDLELALKRIESFGGADIEGVRRRFILYMLCLMELTLLGSKDAPFRKDTIDKLLKHLDEQIPVDNSIINWSMFFPSYTMFLMACECAKLELDYLILFKRTEDLDNEWVKQLGPYTDLQFDVLLQSCQIIPEGYSTFVVLKEISKEQVKQGMIDQVLERARVIHSEHNPNSALSVRSFIYVTVSNELAKQGNAKEAASSIDKALEYALCITEDYYRNDSLIQISSELAKQGKIEQAFKCASIIHVNYRRDTALINISSELALQGSIEEAEYAMNQALECARSITIEHNRADALKKISFELVKQGKIEQAIECAQSIAIEYKKYDALMKISFELVKQGKIEQALDYISDIHDDFHCALIYKAISCELSNHGKIDEAESAMDQALQYALSITRENDKWSTFKDISSELANQGRFEESDSAMVQAIECARSLTKDSYTSSALIIISRELALQGKIEDAESAFYQALDFANSWEYNRISDELAKQGKYDGAQSTLMQGIGFIRGVSTDFKISEMPKISIELAKQGKMALAFECALEISDEYIMCSAMIDISSELAKQKKIEEADSAMERAFEYARRISDEFYSNSILKKISIELAKQNKIKQALECARSITNDYRKSLTLKDIFSELVFQGKIEEADSTIYQALECARKIKVNNQMIIALLVISSELALQGRMGEAESTMNQVYEFVKIMPDEYKRNIALINISSELAKQNKIEQALECARGMTDEDSMADAFHEISIELALQGKVDLALKYARGIQDNFLGNKEISYELVNQGRIEDAIECARSILRVDYKNQSLEYISITLFKQSNWEYAEKIGFEITQLADRQSCWKTIAGVNYKEVGWQKSLQQVTCFKTDEARMFYLKGWVEAVDLYEVNSDCVKEALSIIAHDTESIETLLQKHALHEVFLSNANSEKINQLNHSLNIQWMLDIANQFPNSNSKTRLSTNIETWLHEIEDEDDRERVELWAMKVSKGTMNEEEFKLKLEKISFI
jgi:hypothetical protein